MTYCCLRSSSKSIRPRKLLSSLSLSTTITSLQTVALDRAALSIYQLELHRRRPLLTVDMVIVRAPALAPIVDSSSEDDPIDRPLVHPYLSTID